MKVRSRLCKGCFRPLPPMGTNNEWTHPSYHSNYCRLIAAYREGGQIRRNDLARALNYRDPRFTSVRGPHDGWNRGYTNHAPCYYGYRDIPGARHP